MAKTYTFTVTDDGYDVDETTYQGSTETTVKSLTTDSDTWTGYDGPVYAFFQFLKGIGFVFDNEAKLGVLTTNLEGKEVFRSADGDVFDL